MGKSPPRQQLERGLEPVGAVVEGAEASSSSTIMRLWFIRIGSAPVPTNTRVPAASSWPSARSAASALPEHSNTTV